MIIIFRFSHAAAALEQCDRKYKAVFAEPRKPNNTRNETPEKANSLFDGFAKQSLLLPPTDISNEGYTRLQVVASPSLNQDQLWKLFDVVPSKYMIEIDVRNIGF